MKLFQFKSGLTCKFCPIYNVQTLCDPMDCSLPGSSVHGILQARILEWVAVPVSRGSSQPRNFESGVSCIAGGFFTSWATREALNSALPPPAFYCFIYSKCTSANNLVCQVDILLSVLKEKWGQISRHLSSQLKRESNVSTNMFPERGLVKACF